MIKRRGKDLHTTLGILTSSFLPNDLVGKFNLEDQSPKFQEGLWNSSMISKVLGNVWEQRINNLRIMQKTKNKNTEMTSDPDIVYS